jgi:hypothetical protein
MLTLNDGRTELWQWDTGRTINVPTDCSQVHFSNKVFGRSIDVDVVDGVANIPDILLQTDKDLTAWAFVGEAENGYTKISKVFKVNKRNKPADYVFTPTDQTTLGELLDRIEDLENRPGAEISKEEIQNAVNNYLDKNPIPVEETDPTVPEWAKQPKKPTYTAIEVGALSADTVIPPPYELPPATADSLGGVKAIPATDAMTEYVGIDADGKLRVPKAEGGGGEGTTDHSAMLNRDLPDQHPMSAITGLEEALANAGGGSGSGWKTLIDMQLTEPVYELILKTDMSGNAIQCNEIKFSFHVPETFTGNKCFIGAFYPDVGAGQVVMPYTANKRLYATGQYTNTGGVLAISTGPANGSVPVDGVTAYAITPGGNTGSSSVGEAQGKVFVRPEKLIGVRFQGDWEGKHSLPFGTKIIVQGR